MNYNEAHNFMLNTFIPEIKNKFIETWGKDVFLHNNTTDKEVYYSTNGSMYGWYIEICNSLLKLPETIKYKSSRDEHDFETTFQSKVWVVEPLGSEQLVYLKGESGTLIARFESDVKIHSGDEIELTVDMEKGHIFNKETEEAIF